MLDKTAFSENRNLPKHMHLNNKIIVSANVQKRDHYYTFSKHIHSDIEIYHILSGECKMDICKDTVICRQNDLIVILPNTVHSFYLDCEEPCEFQHIHFNPNFLDRLYFDQISLLSCLTSSFLFYYKIPADERTCALVNFILARNQETDLFSNADANLHLALLLLQIPKKCNSGSKTISFDSASQNRYVAFTLAYIKKNFSNKILIADIAAPLHISSRYLSKIFLQHTDLTILNYINIYRINQSIQMMTETDLPLSKIAVRIGCAGSQHFSKMFRNIIGLSPLKYKELLKCQH